VLLLGSTFVLREEYENKIEELEQRIEALEDQEATLLNEVIRIEGKDNWVEATFVNGYMTLVTINGEDQTTNNDRVFYQSDKEEVVLELEKLVEWYDMWS
jgi:chaperonin cofactor prefoldin